MRFTQQSTEVTKGTSEPIRVQGLQRGQGIHRRVQRSVAGNQSHSGHRGYVANRVHTAEHRNTVAHSAAHTQQSPKITGRKLDPIRVQGSGGEQNTHSRGHREEIRADPMTGDTEGAVYTQQSTEVTGGATSEPLRDTGVTGGNRTHTAEHRGQRLDIRATSEGTEGLPGGQGPHSRAQKHICFP